MTSNHTSFWKRSPENASFECTLSNPRFPPSLFTTVKDWRCVQLLWQLVEPVHFTFVWCRPNVRSLWQHHFFLAKSEGMRAHVALWVKSGGSCILSDSERLPSCHLLTCLLHEGQRKASPVDTGITIRKMLLHNWQQSCGPPQQMSHLEAGVTIHLKHHAERTRTWLAFHAASV